MSHTKSTIRPLLYEDLGNFWEMHDGLYPSDKSRRVEWFYKLMTELPAFAYYGAFRDGKMVGGMAIGDFELNIHSQMVKMSSVGMVRTDMLHKKEKICKDMMEYFIESNRQKGIHVLTLTPSRPDFYKKMGFGYGSSLYMFRVIDIAGLFNELSGVNFNNQNAVLEISVQDTFYPQNNGATVIEFTDGKASVCSHYTATNNENIKIHLDIADFSSLIMGAINVKTLYRLGLLKISDTDSLELLECIFSIGQKPLSAGGL